MDVSQLSTSCSSMYALLETLAKLSREKRIKKIKSCLEFKKIFNTTSVQGIAGLVDPVSMPDIKQVVFKLSIEINRTIEHEHYILSKLNALREYCPNFIGTLGMLPAYVNRSFFEEQEHDEDTNIFDAQLNPVETNYLLLEYAGDIAFRHVIKYSSKATVTGVLIGVLCALQIAQNKLNFVHYDLHSDNILMKQIEEDSWFAYVIKGKVVTYPTFGLYPVIIDMGSSHVQGINEHLNRTSICHYHRGLQSNKYDKLNDVHHFLLSALSSLEIEYHQPEEFQQHFRVIATRVMHTFRHFEIWREQGWKELPHDLVHMFNSLVAEAKTEPCKFYRDLRTTVIETLSLGVKLPWVSSTDQDLCILLKYYYSLELPQGGNIELELVKKGMEDIFHFLEMLDEETDSDINVLFALRALAEQAGSLKETGKTFALTKKTITDFKHSLQTLFPRYTYNTLDISRCFRGALVVTKLLRHLLGSFNAENEEVIEEGTRQTEIKEPIDVIPFLLQNTAIPYKYTPDTLMYIWDSDAQKHHKVSFGVLGLGSSTQDDNTKRGLKKIQQKILTYCATK